mgnify:CR=1 FL=1
MGEAHGGFFIRITGSAKKSKRRGTSRYIATGVVELEQVKSEKVFFNVFPTLKVGDELQMLFSDVEVKKITTNSGRDFLHIHILCRHLIQKKQIWLMEQRIKEQLFGRAAVKIEIVEEFQLSELYTPQAILTEYRESLIEELRQTSVLAANMFARADLRFEEGNLIHLELLDTIVSEGRKEEAIKPTGFTGFPHPSFVIVSKARSVFLWKEYEPRPSLRC